jgi:hypothetical protein
VIGDITAIVAPRIAKLVLGLAGTMLVLTLLVLALGYHLASWPIRRSASAGSNRDTIEALLGVAGAAAVLVATIQARKARKSGT